MNEDIQLSSSPLASEIADVEHKHFSLYVPLLVLGLLMLGAALMFVTKYDTSPQVAGASTEIVDQNP